MCRQGPGGVIRRPGSVVLTRAKVMREAVFLIRTADRKGLLARISGFFYSRQLNVLECRQYSDMVERTYFMRVAVELDEATTKRSLEDEFSALAAELDLRYSVGYNDDDRRVAVMVTRESHCLYDLLMHSDEGTLGGRVVLVVGNHPELETVAARFRVPYFCLPVVKGREQDQEHRVLSLLELHRVDLVVLARYMRILSSEFISRYRDRIINIHHAFLPAFQGGNPYRRAWERGVKMIGATAHYATGELDEGPIIEQDVERITHEDSPDDLRDLGRDIERRVLTRAVRCHLERRIIISGRRTVVFGK